MKYLSELEVDKAKPIHFKGCQLGKRQQLVSKTYTHMWALAYVLATTEEIITNIEDENLQTKERQGQSLGTGEIPKVKTHNLQTNLSYQYQ